MKSKKLISLLLAGAMTLPFAFWTVSADDELTLLASDNFAGGVDGYAVANRKETSAANPAYDSTVTHTDDGSGALEYGLWVDEDPSHIYSFSQTAILGVGTQLKNFKNLDIQVGKKYKVSAYVKGKRINNYKGNYRLGITTANYKSGEVKAYAAFKPTTSDWTQVSFDWEPTTPVNMSWYLRLYVPNDQAGVGFSATNLAYNNNSYDILYVDDVTIEEYAATPLELVGVTKGGATLKNDSTLYNNEKITVEFSKNLQSDHTGAVSVVDEEGTEVTANLSVSDAKLNITIPDAVQGEKYTLKLGNFTALDGTELNLGLEYNLTADNKVIFYDTFDENACAFNKAAYLKYTNETADVNGNAESGVLRMGLFGNDMAGHQQCGTYIASRTIGGKIEAGKTYEISAYIKGQTGRFRNGFKFAMGVGASAAKDNTANNYITVTDEWQKISILWTPADSNTDYSKYVVYLNPYNEQFFDEGSVESDTNYNVFYIDDVMVREKPSFELVSVTPDEGTVLKAGDSGITAEFNLPVSEKSVVTVTNGKGVVVNSTVTVNNTKLNVAIPNRDHGETYTVSFDNIKSASGDELTVEKTYTYTADTTIMNQTFDESMGTFGVSDWLQAVKNCYAYSSSENHTPGNNGGSALLSMRSDDAFNGGRLNYSANFGIDSDLGTGIEAGRNYVVSAYVKGEPERYIDGFKFQMGIYRLNEQTKGSFVHDVVADHPVELKVTDEWQKMSFVWTAPSDLSDLKLRINPVYEQNFNSGANNYDIFYIDDVSIMPVGNVPSAYLSDVAVTCADGDTTKPVTTAADLNGKALTISATLTNLGANAQPYTVIAAVYDENGKLIDVKAAEGSMEVGSKADITVTGLDLTNVSEVAEMKIFAWDRSNNTQTPLTGVYNPF